MYDRDDEEKDVTHMLEVIEIPKQINTLKVGILALFVVAGGVGNSVSGKIVTVPMNDFSFFLGLFNSFVYTVVYFIALAVRVNTGSTSFKTVKWVWQYESRFLHRNIFFKLPPIKYLILIGFLDGLSQILDLTSRPHLPGALISLLPQSSLFFSVVISFLVLNDRFTYWQVWSVLLLLCGVVITLIPDMAGGFSSVGFEWILLSILQTIPTTFSFMLKDYLFRINQELDPFIVSSHNSLFQLLLQPILATISLFLNPSQLAGTTLSTYIAGGFQCWAGITPSWLPPSRDCSPQPWTYLIYIAFNLTLNISIIFFLKEADMVITFLIIRLILPLSVLAFYINWPLLVAPPFDGWCIVGLAVIMFALFTYKLSSMVRDKHKLGCCALNMWGGIPHDRYTTQ